MKLTINIDEDVAREFARWHGTARAGGAGVWVAEAIAAALPPQGRPIQPGDRIRYGTVEGIWLGRHRGRDVVWWDADTRPTVSASLRRTNVTHADGTPVEWPEVES